MPDFSASVRLPASRAVSRQSAPAARTASNAEVSVHRNNVQSAESIHPPPVIRRILESPPVRICVCFPSDTTSSLPVIRTVQLRRDAACPAIRQTSRSAICRELLHRRVSRDCRYLKEENIEQRLLPDYSEQQSDERLEEVFAALFFEMCWHRRDRIQDDRVAKAFAFCPARMQACILAMSGTPVFRRVP